MGLHNSSLTRVQPVFNALLEGWPDGEPWLGDLWEMAVLTRPGIALPRPASLGRLLPEETSRDETARLGKVFERTVPPPIAFLQWLLEHPDQMQVQDRISFGAKSQEAVGWRGKLFSGDPDLVREAQSKGLEALGKRLAQRGRQKWWAFEGFTHVDCCLITDRCVVLVEGKRTETLSASTRWFPHRSQLWRNLEAAKEFAGKKDFAVILAVESEGDGQEAVTELDRSLALSYPHLPVEEQQALNRRFLGYVTWADIVSKFNLPPDCMIERLAERDPGTQ